MLHLIALAAAAISSAASVQAARAPALTQVQWVATPTGADIASVYPPTAVAAGKGGAVLLECQVQKEGSLGSCKVQIEDPVGLEFGAAALELAPLFKMAPMTAEGVAVEGRTVRIPILFQVVTNGD
jgi:TonB family protein